MPWDEDEIMLDSRITVATRIKMINEQIERECNQRVKKYQTTGAQLRALMAIYYTEDHTESMKNLEGIFGVSQQNILGLVQRLEEKQLLTRRVNEEDRRSRKVQLTEEGLKLCEEASKELRVVDDWILKDLSAKERKTLLELLTKIHTSLDSENCEQTEKRHD